MDKIEEAIRQLEDIKKQIANSKNDIMKEQTKFSVSEYNKNVINLYKKQKQKKFILGG